MMARIGRLVATLLLAVPLVAHGSTVAASSELRDEAGKHTGMKAFDGLLSTGWAEAQDDAGAGSWVEISLDRPLNVVSVSVWPGNLTEGKRSLKAYGRPRTLTITLFGSGEPVLKEVRLEDGALVGTQRVDVPIRGVDVNRVRVTVDDAYEGIIHNDTYITEVALNFADGEPHPWVAKIFAWLETSGGMRARDASSEKVKALVERITASEEGDPQALAELMQHAGDGAPYLQDRVLSHVPIGYRVQALPPDKNAVEALLEIRDPNAIPALEQAATRVLGHDERRYRSVVEMMYAHQELIGGTNPNAPNWGQSGWSRGELQSFGEPLQLDIDQFGEIYVADSGNSRVQRFSDTGHVNRVWGLPEPAIANNWIGEERTWYVSGARPGDQDGGFTTPIDLTLIPGKHGDSLAVLDALGRIQVFDAEGTLTASWRAPVHNVPLIAGVGGQAYLEWSKKGLVLVWADEVYVFTLEGDEVDRWGISDGTPSAAVILKNGKLGVVVGAEMILYSLDGFRHGIVLGDELGEGYEAWDVTLDENGALWAVTDTGWAVKYKKPGKVEFRVKISDDPLWLPRIAVRDNVIYLLQNDSITPIDVLEKRAAQALEGDG